MTIDLQAEQLDPREAGWGVAREIPQATDREE
jgi:hypothetical protein